MKEDGWTIRTDTRGYKNDGRLTFGSAIIKLYRGDAVWRGSVDMIVIGALTLFLTQGFPEIPNIFSSPSNTPQTEQPIAQPAATQTAPNFAPVQDSAQQHEKAPSKAVISKPVTATNFPRIWIGNLTDEDKKKLEEISNLVGVDNTKVIEEATKKAESGDVNYQYLLAVSYINQASQLNQTPEKAAHFEKGLFWYKEAGIQGHPEAQTEVGKIYRLSAGTITQDIAESIKWYEMAAANPLGTGGAENELGRIYEAGQYKPKDLQKAFEYYKRGAEKGDSNAQLNVGSFYYNGSLGVRDLPKAFEWTKKSAEQGNPKGQFNLAIMYKRGRATGQPDYNSFLDWAQRAAEQNNIDAMLEIGNFYRSGESGSVDNKLAAKWYRQAALKKHPRGQFLFAEMYEQGLGLPQDYIQSYVYYSLAQQGGFAMASGSLANLKSKMSPAQLDHAEKMMKALKEP